jgi:hypothetical protein
MSSLFYDVPETGFSIGDEESAFARGYKVIFPQ